MNANMIIMIFCVVALICLGLWIYLRSRKNKSNKVNPQDIPQEVLEIYNEAEQEKKKHPEKEPYQILWEVTKKHHDYSKLIKGGENNGTTEGINNGRGTPDIQGLGTIQKSELQSLGDTGDKKVKKLFKRIDWSK